MKARNQDLSSDDETKVGNVVVTHNNLICLEFLLDDGWFEVILQDSRIVLAAVKSNNLQMLKVLHNRIRGSMVNGQSALAAALMLEHLDIIEFLLQNGHRIDEDRWVMMMDAKNASFFESLLAAYFSEAKDALQKMKLLTKHAVMVEYETPPYSPAFEFALSHGYCPPTYHALWDVNNINRNAYSIEKSTCNK